MNINFVSRSDIKMPKKSSSKYDVLLQAIQKLKKGGQVLEVTYTDEAELNSMRNVVYTFNKEHNKNIKSSKDSKKNVVHFYVNK